MTQTLRYPSFPKFSGEYVKGTNVVCGIFNHVVRIVWLFVFSHIFPVLKRNLKWTTVN